MRLRSKAVLVVLALVTAVPAIGSADAVGDAAGVCDPLDPAYCMLPFPSDFFTVADPGTPTGRRVHIDPLAPPRALGAVPLLMEEWNRNDGWSPGSPLMTFVPGLDLRQTWGATTDHITDIARYEDPDAPIVIVNTATGERHPFWSELDTHPATGDAERMLIVRPAVNFDEATRYVVALRAMKDASGAAIPAGSFADYRDGTGSDAARQADVTRITAELAGYGIPTPDLYLAWEFTVASADSLAGRALHMRDEAFAMLGDTDLDDGAIQGDAPAFRVTQVIPRDGDTTAMVHGSFEVPNFLVHHAETPELYDPTNEQLTEERLSPVYTPHSRLYYPTPPALDPDVLPEVNPAQPVFEAHFTCRIPSTASASNPARPVLMGHGLLGERREVGWSSGSLLTREHNVMYCGTEWLGMAFGDIPQAVSILANPGLMPSMPDRALQGFVNFLYLGRLMLHADGLSSSPTFEDLIDTGELFYDGNSQGGIMGGALAALAVDYTKASLGVPGMNYSTLLNRSVDWEGAYGEVYYASIRDKREQQIGMGLIQMLWDRAEANGYAAHMTDDPYPNTPAHQVMLNVAFGDFQVANVSAEVEARTIGARLLQTSLDEARHWSVDPAFGLDVFDTDSGAILPWGGSAIVYWDSGNLVPPNGNLAPPTDGGDPHGDPRGFVRSGVQRSTFFDTGTIVDVMPGSTYCTRSTPRVASAWTTCPAA
ncbi:MAG TPA: hypothetical protein VGB83_08570 [Actinomycetota bacterium]